MFTHARKGKVGLPMMSRVLPSCAARHFPHRLQTRRRAAPRARRVALSPYDVDVVTNAHSFAGISVVANTQPAWLVALAGWEALVGKRDTIHDEEPSGRQLGHGRPATQDADGIW